MADQFPNNTPSQVRPIALASPGKQSFRDSLDLRDRRDYHAITLKRRSILDLTLKGMKRGANFDLSLLDSNNRLIERSTQRGSQTESIQQEVAAGTYYLRVDRQQGQSNYALLAKASVKRDQAGNTLRSARSLRIGRRATSYDDYVGLGDEKDYYKFTLQGDPSHRFRLDATGIDGNAIGTGLSVRILDNTGAVVESFSKLEADLFAETVLAAGTYYLDISAYFTTGSTDYRMRVSAKGIKDPAGNTFANARSVEVDSRPTTLNDFIGRGDQIDYYTFTLDGAPSHDFSLSLGEPRNNLLNDPLTVAIRDSSGAVIAERSTSTDGSRLFFNRVLAQGTYFVEVTPRFTSAKDVPYKLQLSSDRIPDSAGNTLATARRVGLGTNIQTFTDFVGEGDPIDIYRFSSITSGLILNVNVSGVGSDLLEDGVVVRLRNQDGVVLTSRTGGSDGGAVSFTRNGLVSGVFYYVEVERQFSSNNRTNYDIDLFATIP